MSKVIVGEGLEKELRELTKIAEELRNVYDRVYDLLEHWELEKLRVVVSRYIQ